MAKVPLRVYCREIEDAIEQQQIDEAIAHCHQIIKAFPKHIDTYRLLGKAYLESQRFGNAGDLFQRVLSSIPDDFISHLGMSIIREDEVNLDAALWHMERAFESQPYNSAIQGELRRLFGRRDSMEPPKIRLTPGALARMYAKGNLFDQAIAEIDSALSTDPQRSDLLILLAQMYAKSGRISEAIETSSALIKRLPYCLEANRIIAQLLPPAENQDAMKVCRQRLQALDPYEAHITEKTPGVADVPDQVILVDRLIWDGGPVVAQSTDQPDWASTAGINMENSGPENAIPDWMDSDNSFSFDRGNHLDEEDEGFPNWGQDAGWETSTNELDESPSIFSLDNEEEEATVDGAISGDIPDWLQEMAPNIANKSVGQPPASITAATLDQDMPDWLSQAADGASDSIVAWLGDKNDDGSDKTQNQGTEEETPDWLADMGQTAIASSAVAASSKTNQPDPSEESIPDWLADMGETRREIVNPVSEASDDQFGLAHGENKMADNIPDWLMELGDDNAEDDDNNLQEDGGAEPGIIPDWLKDKAPTGPAVQPDSSRKKLNLEDDEEIPDWLQGFNDEPSEKESPVEAVGFPPEDSDADDVPDWLKDLSEETLEPEIETAPIAQNAIIEDEAPDWLQDLADLETEPALQADSGDDDIPDWLKDLSGDEAVPDSEPDFIAQEPVAEADIPDWLKGFEDELPDESPDELLGELLSELPAESEPATPPLAEDINIESASPDWLQEFEDESQPEETSEFEDATVLADIPDWLKNLGDESPASEPLPEAELSSVDEDKTIEAEIPDWLLGLRDEITEPEEAPQAEQIPVTQEENIETDIPDWLRDFGDETPSEPEAAIEYATSVEMPEESDDTAIPDWLRDFGDEAPSEPEPAPTAEYATSVEMPEESDDSVIPDWLQDFGDETPSEPEAAIEYATSVEMPEESDDSAIPDWLQEFNAEISDKEEPVIEPVAQEETATADIPDWLKEKAPVEEMAIQPEAIIQPEIEPESVETPVDDITDFDSAMAWLEGLAAKQGISEDELLTSPEERSEIPPEWVQKEIDQVEERVEVIDEETIITIPDTETAADFPEWLAEPTEELPPFESVKGETLQDTSYPEWLREPETSPLVDEMVTPDGPEPTSIEIENQIPSEAVSAIPAWLVDPQSDESAPEPTDDQEPVIEPAEYPEWLTQPQETPLAIEFDEPEADFISPEAIESEALQVPDLDDADAAMAWLEGLAAKQGVPEEELLSTPEERSETPPDWVQEPLVEIKSDAEKVMEDVSLEPEITEEDEDEFLDWLQTPEPVAQALEPVEEPDPDLIDWLEEPGLAEPAIASEPPSVEPSIEDDLPEFLREASAQDSAPTEQKPSEALAPEAFAPEAFAPETLAPGTETQPETIIELDSDDLPEFLRTALEADEAIEPAIEIEPEPAIAEIPPVEPSSTPDHLPAWLQDALREDAIEDETQTLVVEEPVQADLPVESAPVVEPAISQIVETPDLEPELVAPPVAESQPETLATTELPAEEDAPSTEFTPPTWVLEGEEPEDIEDYTWVPTGSDEPVAEELPPLLEINEASLVQLERLQALGFRRAQAIVAYRTENGPFTKLEELLNVPGIETSEITAIRSLVSVTPPPAPEPKPTTGPLPPMPEVEPEDEFHAKQLDAKTGLAKGEVDEALKQYGQLIKKGKRLDNVIEDLDQSLAQDIPNEVCIEILQTLGDAYMKADRIQDALDAYTKAEELLR